MVFKKRILISEEEMRRIRKERQLRRQIQGDFSDVVFQTNLDVKITNIKNPQ